MSPAVRTVALLGMAALAAVVVFLVRGCRSRWAWFDGFFVGDDPAAGDPDDDIWENAGTRPDDIDRFMASVRGEMPKDQWLALYRHLRRRAANAGGRS